MKRTVMATILGSVLVAAGAYAADEAKKYGEAAPQAPSAQGSTERGAETGASGAVSGSAAQGPSAQTSQQSSEGAQGTASTSARAYEGPQDLEKVKQVQSALASQGYDPGPIDGKLGNRTKHALKQAQKDKGLEETGQLDQQTMAALGMNESGQSAGSTGG